MVNLAGNKDADKTVALELERARIPVKELPVDERGGEVPCTIMGQAGEFKFRRAWTYWRISGRIPLKIALDLYADPVGKTDVRVNGSCVCPEPGTHGGQPEFINPKTNRQVCSRNQEHAWNELIKRHPSWADDEHTLEFADDPATVAEAFIMTYHIDSEVGLRLFMDTLRKAGLVPPV